MTAWGLGGSAGLCWGEDGEEASGRIYSKDRTRSMNRFESHGGRRSQSGEVSVVGVALLILYLKFYFSREKDAFLIKLSPAYLRD